MIVSPNDIIEGVIVTLVAMTITGIFAIIRRSKRKLLLYLRCKLFLRNKQVRVSMSALMRIKQGGRYALFRSELRPERFNPPGGVYKFYEQAAREFEHLEFVPENGKQGNDELMGKDLRGFLPGRNLPEFIEWFNRESDRELYNDCILRELTEELREVGLTLEANNIGRITLRKVCTRSEGPRKVAGENYLQYRVFDTITFCEDDPQGKAIVNTVFSKVEQPKNPNDALIIAATVQEIEKGRSVDGQTIATHAPYLYCGKAMGGEPPMYGGRRSNH